MAVYQRRDSPFWWLYLERPGLKALWESTKIPVAGGTDAQTRENRRLAEQAYAVRMGDLARSRYQIVASRPTITFRAHATWYLQHVSPQKRNLARERSMLTAHLIPAFGALPLGQIGPADAQEWVSSRRTDGAKPATIKRELELLRGVLSSAIPKYLEANPLKGFPGKGQLRIVRAEPRILTREEDARLLKGLTPENRALVICALDTLMRLSDVATLRRSADHGTYLTVVDPKVQTYKVPVSSRLRRALDRLPATSEWYFPSHYAGRRGGDRMAQNAIIRMFRAACAAAEIPYGRQGGGVTFHALRHTGASRALESGASVRTVQELGGWKNLTQLTRYTHPTEIEKRDAVEAIGRRRSRASRTGR